MTNSLNLNSPYYYIFINLSMIAYIIEFKNQNLLIIFNSVNGTNLNQDDKLKFRVYFYPVEYPFLLKSSQQLFLTIAKYLVTSHIHVNNLKRWLVHILSKNEGTTGTMDNESRGIIFHLSE